MTSTTDRAGQVEVHGIDFIPDAERHGRARELFMIWAASNITYLYIVVGGALILLGLNPWEAMAVVVAGNLFWAWPGILATSGPSSGTPSSVVMRSMFGVRGNRVNVAIVGWGISVAYEAINLAIGSLAGFALVQHLGLHANLGVKLAIVFATAVVTLTISVYGHATIVRLSGGFTVLLAGSVAILGYCILRHANWHFAPAADAPHGAALWAAACIGLTVVASGPLSWGVSADYARYLPATTSAKSVAWWTAIGGFIPSVVLGGLGVLAGTVIDMTDPQTSFKAILPSWFYPLFLLVIVIGSMTNNILTAYSSGLALQAVGIPWSRALTVFFDGVVGVAITCYALFLSNFLSTLNNILELSVALLAPSLTIYLVDVLLRRNRYDGRQLHDETPTSPFWFNRGVNWAGVTAQIVGTTVSLLCADTTLLVGPISRQLGGADLSALSGPIVAATIYSAAFVFGRRPVSVGGPTSVHTPAATTWVVAVAD
jgi:NCS1 family nucleobase:cation symporter-1